MRILMVTGEFYPMIGGLQTHVRELSMRMLDLRHDIEIIADRKPENSPNFEDMNGLRVYRIAKYKLNDLKILQYWRKIRERLEKFDPEIVHAHMLTPSGLSALLANYGYRKPLILTVHGHDVHIDQGIAYGNRLKARYRLASDWAIRQFDKVICVCRAIQHDVLSLGVADTRTTIIYNGTQLQPNGNSHREIDGYFLYVGRISPEKGVDYIVEAAKSLPELRFVIVGDGPIKHDLEQKAPANVTLLGRIVNPETLADIYERCAVAVFPSIVDMLPLAILEAMSYGKPVVASNVGGIPEVVTNEYNGLLIQPRSLEGLIKAIAILSKDQDLRKRLGTNARQTVSQRFSWDAIAKQTLAVYDDVLSKAIRR